MEFDFSLWPTFGVMRLLVEAILISISGIVSLIAFIVLRRWYRARYFQRLSERTYFWRSRWAQLSEGKLAAQNWRRHPLDRQVVESMLLDSIETADGEIPSGLLECLRSSGLLDLMILEARTTRGWTRRTALIALGRTRAPEALPALAEALDSESQETRIAAVRGLERTGLAEGAVPLLDKITSTRLKVPEHTLKNALVSCCRTRPDLLVDYLLHSTGEIRELLARVLGELATPELQDELLILSADPLPEVRASAARAVATAQPIFASHILSDLSNDPEWYVRLRAVVALGSVNAAQRIRPLLRALADPVDAVRKRAACVLYTTVPAFEGALAIMLDAEDPRPLQELIAQLESSGVIAEIIRNLQNSASSPFLGSQITEALSRSAHFKGKDHVKAAGGASR